MTLQKTNIVTLHIILNGDERKPGGKKQVDHILKYSSPDCFEGLEGLRDCEIWLQQQRRNPEIHLLADNASIHT